MQWIERLHDCEYMFLSIKTRRIVRDYTTHSAYLYASIGLLTSYLNIPLCSMSA